MVEVFGSRTPSFSIFTWCATEASVVVRQEAAQDLVGGDQIVGPGQTQLTGESILEGAPETLDTAFGLGTLGRDVGDAELLQSAAELSKARGDRRVALPRSSESSLRQRRCGGPRRN